MKTYTQAHAQAQSAIHAAANRHKWGKRAALNYANKRGIGALYRLAVQLDIMQKVGF